MMWRFPDQNSAAYPLMLQIGMKQLTWGKNLVSYLEMNDRNSTASEIIFLELKQSEFNRLKWVSHRHDAAR